jgi:two-component system response regulator HydG
LIVDEQRSARRVLRHMLSSIGQIEVYEATSAEEAKPILLKKTVHMVITDIRLSSDPMDSTGLKLLAWMKELRIEALPIVVTSGTHVDQIREAIRLGAQDYVLKDELSTETIRVSVDKIRAQMEKKGLLGGPPRGAARIIGRSEAMERVRWLVRRVADADAPILIRGETGSGKELVARAIHEESNRKNERFLAVNCSALPGTLVESMIFGHERGAFTGAMRRVRGQLELAGSGTLLLDEIAEMGSDLQAKLLRVLEDRFFQPLGSEEVIPLSARVLAATHVNLERRIAEGTFREDLYYRLNVVTIEVPPLRDRMEDLPELLQSFCGEQPRQLDFTEAAIAWLERRPWPGNVRELRNAVERLALLCENDRVNSSDLRELVGDPIRQAAMEIGRIALSILALPPRVGSKLDVMERAVLHQAMLTCQGNKSAAARLVGLDRKALDRRWERLAEALDEDLARDND